jgi:hypothetical protein
VNLGLSLSGRHTAGFRCGCLFARGDAAGVARWRLCPSHGSLRRVVAEIFGRAERPCVVTLGTRLPPRRPRGITPAACLSSHRR